MVVAAPHAKRPAAQVGERSPGEHELLAMLYNEGPPIMAKTVDICLFELTIEVSGMTRSRIGATAQSPRVARVGCDLASVDAVAESIAVFGDRYLNRIYTATELAESNRAPERLAARFAGKEAVLKVLRTSAGLTYSEIEIVTDTDGAPRVRLAARARRQAARQRIGPISISLSHECGYAVATAVALPQQRKRP